MTVKVGLSAGAVLAVAGLAVVGFVGWKLYSTGAEFVQGIKDGLKKASDAVSLNTTLPDAAYGDPAAQEQANAIYGKFPVPIPANTPAAATSGPPAATPALPWYLGG